MQQATKLGRATDERRRPVLLWRQGESPHERRLRRLRLVVEDRDETWRTAQRLSTGPSLRRNLTALGNRDHARQRLPLADERAAGFSKLRRSQTQKCGRYQSSGRWVRERSCPRFRSQSQNIHWRHLSALPECAFLKTAVQMRNFRAFRSESLYSSGLGRAVISLTSGCHCCEISGVTVGSHTARAG